MALFSKTSNDPPLLAEAKRILAENSHALLKCAWDEYLHIKQTDEAYEDDVEMRQITPAWFALERLVELGGKLEDLGPEDKLLLKHLQHGHLIYNEILHALIDHHDDEEEAKHLFEKHPELHEHLPAHLNSDAQVMNAMVEVIRQYKIDLEQFSDRFWAKIEPWVEGV